jgi:Flp pilus assembly protein TadG
MMPANTQIDASAGIQPPLRRRPCRSEGANDALQGGPERSVGWAKPTSERTRAPGEGQILNRIRALIANVSGLAALEFALVLPVMITAMLGAVESSNIVKSYAKAVSASQTVADLTAQSSALTTAQMNSIVVAAQQVLSPLNSDATVLGVEVISVGFSSTNAPTQLWRFSWGTIQPTLSLTGAKNLGATGDSVVMVTLAYKCIPLVQDIVSQVTFSEVSYSRPRLVRKIPLNGVTG